MKRPLMLVAMAGAAACLAAILQARRSQRLQDQQALSRWEGEGGSPLPEV